MERIDLGKIKVKQCFSVYDIENPRCQTKLGQMSAKFFPEKTSATPFQKKKRLPPFFDVKNFSRKRPMGQMSDPQSKHILSFHKRCLTD